MKTYAVYIMTNPTRSVLYVGVTNDLARRVYEHQRKLVDGFTKRYNCVCLVYFEQTEDILAAIAREKEIKGWRREKKDALIDIINPEREDLSLTLKMTGSVN